MSKFLKILVNLFLIGSILITGSLLIPPLAGVTTNVIDTVNMDTNLSFGSVTYSNASTVAELAEGDKVLVDSGSSLYVYTIQSGDASTGDFTVLDAMDKSSEALHVQLRNPIYKVILTVPFIGYVVVAMQSAEGFIIIILVLVFVAILFILSELWRRSDDDEDDEEEPGEENGRERRARVKAEKAARKKQKKEKAEPEEKAKVRTSEGNQNTGGQAVRAAEGQRALPASENKNTGDFTEFTPEDAAALTAMARRMPERDSGPGLKEDYSELTAGQADGEDTTGGYLGQDMGLRGRTGNLGGQTVSLDGQTGNLGGQTGNLGGQTGSLRGQTGNLGGQTGNHGGRTGNLGGQTGSLRGQTGNLGGQTGNLGGQTGNLGGQTGDLYGQTRDLRGQTGSLRGQTGSLGGRSEDIFGQTRDLRGQTGSLRRQTGSLGGRSEDVFGQTRDLRGQTGSLGGRNEDIFGQTRDLRSQTGSLRSQTGSFGGRSEDIFGQTRDLRSQTGSLGGQTGDSSKLNGSLEASGIELEDKNGIQPGLSASEAGAYGAYFSEIPETGAAAAEIPALGEGAPVSDGSLDEQAAKALDNAASVGTEASADAPAEDTACAAAGIARNAETVPASGTEKADEAIASYGSRDISGAAEAEAEPAPAAADQGYLPEYLTPEDGESSGMDPDHFVPVERPTLEEIVEQARKHGHNPDIHRDSITNVNLVDFSEFL